MTDSTVDTLTQRLDRLEEIKPSQKSHPIGHRRDRSPRSLSCIGSDDIRTGPVIAPRS